MNELIKVETNSKGEQLVSARELHQFLQAGSNVNTWFKRQAERAMLIENEDFVRVPILETSGQTSFDHAIKLSAAKELAMLNGGEKGKQARLYFIECEKKLMNPQPLSELHLIIQSAQQMLQIKEEQQRQSERIAILEAKQTTIQSEYYTIAGYCALRGLNKTSNECNILGRKASKMSKENDYGIGKAHSENYGTVNTYHLDILSQILK